MNKLKLHNKNILDEAHGLIIHGVNAQRKMGSGIAKQIRDRYPIVYDEYMKAPAGKDALGNLQIVKVTDELYIGNGFTQLYYGNDGRRYASVDAIEKVLDKAFKWCIIYNYPLLSPKIGCGLGGLDWKKDVEPIFLEMHRLYPEVDVNIFELDK